MRWSVRLERMQAEFAWEKSVPEHHPAAEERFHRPLRSKAPAGGRTIDASHPATNLHDGHLRRSDWVSRRGAAQTIYLVVSVRTQSDRRAETRPAGWHPFHRM